MEFDSSLRTVSERIKRKLGMLSNQSVNADTGRSYSEESIIAKMEKHGGKAFRILRSAETSVKNYERPAN